MRRINCPALAGAVAPVVAVSHRAMWMPGWKQKVSTRDGRTREKREADRRMRQIDKLPRVQALHDYQYPYDKTVLADFMNQPPVFENGLDTPELFHHTPVSSFFLSMNVGDFERRAFPALPIVDHRFLSCDGETFNKHRSVGSALLEKHGLMPGLIPNLAGAANLSVVWDQPLAVTSDDETPEAAAKRAQAAKRDGVRLTRRNFWHTAHYGNFIPLSDVQRPPSVFLTVPKSKSDALFTLIIATPDYPYRTRHTEGFCLQYVVSNIKGKHLAASDEPTFADVEAAAKPGRGAQAIADALEGRALADLSVTLRAQGGEVVLPYIPPLPTEDAGTTRHMCMLFEQNSLVSNVTAPRNPEEEERMLPFDERVNFRLHGKSTEERAKTFRTLADVEAAIAPDPTALTFFQTSWDIHVQEFYESLGRPEPAYVPDADDDLETQLQFLAMDPAEFRPRTRKLADGAVNADGTRWVQPLRTRLLDGTASHYRSKRTHLGTNKKIVVVPK